MIDSLVSFCLRRRSLVIAVFGTLALTGYYSFTQLPVEAYPDIANVCVQVVAEYPGHAAEEVEQQATIPLERALNGIPKLTMMRSKSAFGVATITLVFHDSADDYWARQRVQERIDDVSLPPSVEVGLSPLTSPVGEIFRYSFQSKTRSQRELRELQEWVVIPRLKQVFGVADVANFGGEASLFQLLLDPEKLAKFNLSLSQIIDAINVNNENAGGSLLVQGEQALVVRGVGLLGSLEDLGRIVVTESGGTPVFLRDLGEVQLGALERRGVFGINDNDDSVAGIVMLLRGENPSRTLEGVHETVAELNSKFLPPDVKIVPYLDRTDLVNTTLRTVSHTLLEGFCLVVIVLVLFLGSLKGAVIVAITIPISMLVAAIGMHLTHIPANLLSLGAIDFGIIVEGSIVLMEAILRRHEEHSGETLTTETAAGAVRQVARPIFFATIIIITGYLPLFAFERVESKLFTPMAFTVGYALVGALFTALTLIPILSYLSYRKPGRVFHNPIVLGLERAYRAVLEFELARPWLAIFVGISAVTVSVFIGAGLGREFLPQLDEGAIWMPIQLPPGVSMEKARSMAAEIRKAAREFPEVAYVTTQLGRDDNSTEPFTLSHVESCIGLKPYAEWGGDKQALIARMDERFKKIPGLEYGFSQPIFDMVNDQIAGAHSELVVKVYGDDLAGTRRLAEKISGILAAIPGATDVAIDQEPPLPQLKIEADRDAAARYGINVADIASLINHGIGGEPVSSVYMGERKYDVAVRYVERVRGSQDAISNLTLNSPSGARIPLSQVAKVTVDSGESTITREMNRRHLTVKLNLRDRDLGAFLTEAQEHIAREVSYDPTVYEVSWGGAFENQQRAQSRLAIILPGTLCLIFLLLYAAFGKVRHAAVIIANVPLALLGGVLALYLREMTLNVSSAVGFIALFGVAVQNGVIIVANMNRWREITPDLGSAVFEGACERLRPVLMTATVATLGLIPAALASGIGSDVQRPLATVIVGGLAVATLLTLVVMPALYFIVEKRLGEHADSSKLESES
jgi:cobalt-zinc-cadmium resistance protein CzcA